jgi:hypothetical protein
MSRYASWIRVVLSATTTHCIHNCYRTTGNQQISSRSIPVNNISFLVSIAPTRKSTVSAMVRCEARSELRHLLALYSGAAPAPTAACDRSRRVSSRRVHKSIFRITIRNTDFPDGYREIVLLLCISMLPAILSSVLTRIRPCRADCLTAIRPTPVVYTTVVGGKNHGIDLCFLW